MTTPSPAPQQWADKAADEIFAIHVETGLTGRCEDVAAIITKHAAAISEENERLKREVEEMREHKDDWMAKHYGLTLENNRLRQWSDQAREALKYLANDDNYMEATFNPCEIASSALAAHPALTAALNQEKKP